jgi:hypothetical protein
MVDGDGLTMFAQSGVANKGLGMCFMLSARESKDLVSSHADLPWWTLQKDDFAKACRTERLRVGFRIGGPSALAITYAEPCNQTSIALPRSSGNTTTLLMGTFSIDHPALLYATLMQGAQSIVQASEVDSEDFALYEVLETLVPRAQRLLRLLRLLPQLRVGGGIGGAGLIGGGCACMRRR